MTTDVGTSIVVACWLLAAVLASGGLALLWFGFWPRRRGTEPRCRGCNYNLTGNTSERCPECGRVLRPNAIVHGTRRKRPWRIGGGVLLLLLAVTAAMPNLMRINWYAYKPTGWVLSDLHNPTLKQQAWFELMRRNNYGAGGLADQHLHRLVAFALAEQARPWGTWPKYYFVDFLGDRYTDGQLTPTEAQQFLTQAVLLKLDVRSPTMLGEEVFYFLEYQMRLPTANYWVELATQEVRVDRGSPDEFSVPFAHSPGVRGDGSLGGRLPPPKVGTHHVAVDVGITVYRGRNMDQANSVKLFETQQQVRQTCVVLADEMADRLITGTVEEQQELMQARLRVERVVCYGTHGSGVYLRANALPVAVAFDVFVRYGTHEEYVGAIACGPRVLNSSWHVGGRALALCVGEPTTCTVILRSSAAAARQSVDVRQYWEGELVFEDVPIERAAE